MMMMMMMMMMLVVALPTKALAADILIAGRLWFVQACCRVTGSAGAVYVDIGTARARTGSVIKAYCMLPDGSIEPPLPPEFAKRMQKR
jgi:hypothetical protein